jgi:hypothetical protein
LAINAARQGMESKIFYSFMGLNLVEHNSGSGDLDDFEKQVLITKHILPELKI